MDIASVKSMSYKGATSHVGADGTGTDAWLNVLRTALDNGPAAARLDGAQTELSKTDLVQTQAAETEAAETETEPQTAVQAGEAAPNAQAHEVQYLDRKTNTTKTSYVINGAAYEDEAGTTPVSDYSRFRTSDGVLQVQTPYGIIRATDFDKLLEYQGRYDTETFGEAVVNSNGNIIGTIKSGGFSVSAPRDSYTSAPSGPGSISQKIFDQYYTVVAGRTPITTVQAFLAGEGDGGADANTLMPTAGLPAASSSGTDSAIANEAAGGMLLNRNSIMQMALAKTLLSTTGASAAGSIMDDAASLAKVMNVSRYQQLFDNASF